jgi:hypothetical protein
VCDFLMPYLRTTHTEQLPPYERFAPESGIVAFYAQDMPNSVSRLSRRSATGSRGQQHFSSSSSYTPRCTHHHNVPQRIVTSLMTTALIHDRSPTNRGTG